MATSPPSEPFPAPVVTIARIDADHPIPRVALSNRRGAVAVCVSKVDSAAQHPVVQADDRFAGFVHDLKVSTPKGFWYFVV